jgi:pimeloyl-ACP methyl ester carboxylesterase
MPQARPYTPAVPNELPSQRRADRSALIGRWVTFGLVALLVVLLVYLAYIGFVGSGQVVDPGRHRDCRTPAIAFGWEYEAINYPMTGDLLLADLLDPTECDLEPAMAEDALVTPDGVSLAGWYIPASSGAGPEAPTIVMAHGHGVNKSNLLSRAEALHDDFNLVLFDFRNHGQSEDAQTTAGLLEREDLRTVIDWLERTKVPSGIGVLGVSMGSATAVNEARADQRVDALVMESTHATLANALQARLELHGYPLALPGAWSILLGGLVRTGQDMSAADPVQAVENYGERPLLLVADGRDDTIGSTDVDDLLAAARSGGARVDLRVCEAAGHGQSVRACPGDYRDWVLGFFADSLGS